MLDEEHKLTLLYFDVLL